jgi:hypothetical protein
MGFKLHKNFYMLPRDIILEKDFLHGRSATFFEARLYLAVRANHKPAEVPISNRTVHVPRGGILSSQVKLADALHWDRKKFRKFLREEERADRLSYVTSLGKKSAYTLIILKDIWNLDADFTGEKWSTDEDNSPVSPHIQYVKDVSSLGGNNSYVGISGSENGFHSGSEDGVLKSARAEAEPIDAWIDYWDWNPSLAEAAALSKLTDAELRRVKAAYEAGQTLAVALMKVKP